MVMPILKGLRLILLERKHSPFLKCGYGNIMPKIESISQLLTSGFLNHLHLIGQIKKKRILSIELPILGQ